MFWFARKAAVQHISVKDASHPVIEGLESRRMLSASLNHHGLLNISGTGRHDEISVSIGAADTTRVEVSVNGKVTSYDSAKVSRIRINAAGGADKVTIDASIIDPCTVLGGGGNDTLVAGGGDDSLSGGAGDDDIEAGEGNDILRGGAGHDHLVATTGNCILDGGAGNDSLQGGSGDDSLLGGLGDDSIVSGAGNSHIDGGRGHDQIDFDAPTTAGVVLDSLTPAVQAGLTSLAQGATISSVIRFQEHNRTFFWANVTIDGIETRIVVDSAGNPVTQTPDDHGNDGNTEHHHGDA